MLELQYYVKTYEYIINSFNNNFKNIMMVDKLIHNTFAIIFPLLLPKQ